MAAKVPYNQWLKELSTADFKAYNDSRVAKGKARVTRAGKPSKSSKPRTTVTTVKKVTPKAGRKAVVKKTTTTVNGSGAYFIGGHIGYDSEKGWVGGAKAYYTDQEVTGHGAYKLRKNSLMLNMGQDPPRIVNIPDGPTIIRHREALGDLLSPGVTGPTPFSLESEIINPGNQSLFPWLSQIAPAYQSYQFLGLAMELKTLSSDYAQNMALGSIFMATNYNVGTDAPTTKAELENMEYSTSSKPSCSLIHFVECDPDQTINNGHLFIAPNGNYGTVNTTTDPRFYDLGTIHFGSQGIPIGGASICERWVTYEVALFKPTIPPIMPEPALQSWWIGEFTGVSNNMPLGNAYVGNGDQGRVNPGFSVNLGAQQIGLPSVPGFGWLMLYDAQSTTSGTGTWVMPTFSAVNTACTNPGNVPLWYTTSGTIGKMVIQGSNSLQSATINSIHYLGIVQNSDPLPDLITPAIQFAAGTFQGTVNATVTFFPWDMEEPFVPSMLQSRYLKNVVNRKQTFKYVADRDTIPESRRRLLEAGKNNFYQMPQQAPQQQLLRQENPLERSVVVMDNVSENPQQSQQESVSGDGTRRGYFF